MKHLLFNFIMVLISFTNAFAQNTNITIEFTQTSDYCGGAAPSEEMLEELKTPQPMGRIIFYIVKGSKHSYKAYKRVLTSEMGDVELSLPKGKYAIFSEKQMKKFVKLNDSETQLWDNKCLKEKHFTPLLIINTYKANQFKLNIHNKCFYSQDCAKFIGQMPA